MGLKSLETVLVTTIDRAIALSRDLKVLGAPDLRRGYRGATSSSAACVASVAEAEAERRGRIAPKWAADFLFRQASRANSLLRHFFIFHIKTKA